VQLAQDVGYGTVVDLARRAGMNLDIRPTPAVALGAYEVTPLEVAGAYTIFANGGQWVRPNFITTIRDTQGHDFYDYVPEKRQVLDPRVAFVMVSMLEQVLQSGTAAGVRARGFTLPAAGKTGTSHDGWFAGFTSKLICVIWVGYDDNRELNLEGAHSALPVWTEFMKRAHQHIDYRGVTPFQPPAGVVGVQLDPESGQLATPSCPKTRTEYFIEGTQPVESCQMHGGGATRFAGWDTLPPATTPVQTLGKPGTLVIPVTPQPGQQNPQAVAQQQPPANQQDQKKRKGFFGKLKDIFK
ncbi:MAG: penicillin-binding transpeptidase domain-containing protein, partial [Gammaproteobacteria bacterium]